MNEGRANALNHAHLRDDTSAQLRVLATTDVHMQMLGHAYVSDRPMAHSGLASIATLVEDARREASAQGRATLLLDNGDLVQGTALGSWLSGRAVTAAHPVAKALNLMRYDAVGLGNHDLDYGLFYLNQLARHLRMPVISSNLHQTGPSPLHPFALIDCPLPGSRGEVLRVGVLSVLPEQTAVWNRHVLQGSASVSPALGCVQAAVPVLRAQGADLIVLLAHMGIEEPVTGRSTRDSALPLAKVPGIDAIITGHTHRRFPGSDHPAGADIDTEGGTLAQCPASMPGYAASDLAILDLTLNRVEGGRWQVIGHISRLVRNGADTPACPAVHAACAPAHEATRAHLATPVAATAARLQNYFSLATPTATAALVARAKARVIRDALSGRPEADLPLLATASAHTAGGREGADHYLNIPQGPVLRRHVAGLDPYLNEVWAQRVTGADLRRLLEHTSRIYAPLQPGAQAQRLVDARIPSFDFDTVYGLDYTVDPTRRVGQRVTRLHYGGQRVEDDQPFILATNQFRIAGGGGYSPACADQIMRCTPVSLTKALVDALNHPEDLAWPQPTPWRLACTGSTTAVLTTSPDATPFLHDLADLSPKPLGIDDAGFLEVQITL